MRYILIHFYLKYKGSWDKIFSALEKKEKVSLGQMAKIEKKYGNKYITILDDDYAEELKSTFKPPFVYPKAHSFKITSHNKKVKIYDPIFSNK